MRVRPLPELRAVRFHQQVQTEPVAFLAGVRGLESATRRIGEPIPAAPLRLGVRNVALVPALGRLDSCFGRVFFAFIGLMGFQTNE